MFKKLSAIFLLFFSVIVYSCAGYAYVYSYDILDDKTYETEKETVLDLDLGTAEIFPLGENKAEMVPPLKYLYDILDEKTYEAGEETALDLDSGTVGIFSLNENKAVMGLSLKDSKQHEKYSRCKYKLKFIDQDGKRYNAKIDSSKIKFDSLCSSKKVSGDCIVKIKGEIDKNKKVDISSFEAYEFKIIHEDGREEYFTGKIAEKLEVQFKPGIISSSKGVHTIKIKNTGKGGYVSIADISLTSPHFSAKVQSGQEVQEKLLPDESYEIKFDVDVFSSENSVCNGHINIDYTAKLSFQEKSLNIPVNFAIDKTYGDYLWEYKWWIVGAVVVTTAVVYVCYNPDVLTSVLDMFGGKGNENPGNPFHGQPGPKFTHFNDIVFGDLPQAAQGWVREGSDVFAKLMLRDLPKAAQAWARKSSEALATQMGGAFVTRSDSLLLVVGIVGGLIVKKLNGDMRKIFLYSDGTSEEEVVKADKNAGIDEVDVLVAAKEGGKSSAKKVASRTRGEGKPDGGDDKGEDEDDDDDTNNNNGSGNNGGQGGGGGKGGGDGGKQSKKEAASVNGIPKKVYKKILKAVAEGNIEKLDRIVEENDVDLKKIEAAVLRKAVSKGQSEMLEHLIDKYNLDPKVKYEKGVTLLHLAASFGFVKIFESLIDNYKLDLAVESEHGYNPIHIAVIYGKKNIIKKIVAMKKGDLLKVKGKNGNGSSLIHIAALYGRKNMFHYLAELLPENLRFSPYELNENGDTPLHLAVYNNKIAICDYIIDKYGGKIDLWAENKQGLNLLCMAAFRGHKEIFSHLVKKHKLEPNKKNSKGVAPIYYLVGKCNMEDVKELVNKHKLNLKIMSEGGYELIFLAAINEKIQMFDYLVGCGLSMIGRGKSLFSVVVSKNKKKMALHLRDKYKCDPNIELHSAVISGDIAKFEKVVKIFDIKNIKEVRVSKTKRSLFYLSAFYGQKEMMTHLAAKYYFKDKSLDKEGYIMFALAKDKKVDMICYLVNSLGLNINKQNEHGLTVAHVLAAKGDKDSLDKLKNEYGLDLNVVDKRGFAPIHTAALKQKKDMLDHLAGKHKIDIMTKTKGKRGETVLHVAAREIDGKDMILHILEKHKLDINETKDNQGFTVAHVLVSRGYKDTLDILHDKHKLNVEVLDKYGSNLAFKAAAYNQVDMLDHLYKKYGLDVSALDSDGSNITLIVAAMGKPKTLNHIVEKYHIDPKIKNKNSDTAIHLAAHYNRRPSDMIDNLINKHSLDFSIRNLNDKGLSPVHILIKAGKGEELKGVMEKHKSGLNMTNEEYGDLLRFAVSIGKIPAFDYLIQQKPSSIYVKDKEGNTLYSIAVSKRQEKMALHLMERYKDFFNPNFELAKVIISNDDLIKFKYILDIHNLKSIKETGEGSAFLSAVVRHGRKNILNYLIKTQKLSPHDKNSQGKTLGHIAVESDQIDMLLYLIKEHSLNINEKDNKGRTVAHLLAHKGKVDEIDVLVEKHALDVRVKTKRDSTLVHIAAEGNRKGMLDHLVKKHGLDPSAENKDGYTAAHVAAFSDHKELLLYLIKDYKLDVNKASKKGLTIAHILARNGDIKTLDKLADNHSLKVNVKNDAGVTPLHIAAQKGKKEMLDHLVDKHELKIEDTDDESGKNVLHYAALENRLEMLKHLYLNHELDINKPITEAGLTIAHILVKLGYKETLDKMQAYGLNAKAKTNKGSNILHVSTVCYRPETAFDEIVRKYDISPYAVNKDGDTPMHSAACVGNLCAINNSVFKHRLDPNMKNFKGFSPLHLLAMNTNVGKVKSFVETHNPDLMAKDNNGRNVLHLAASHGKDEVLNYLIRDKKLSVDDVKDYDGNTVFGAAVSGKKEGTAMRIEELTSLNLEHEVKHAVVSGDTENFDAILNTFKDSQVYVYDYLLAAIAAGQKNMFDHIVKKYKINPKAKNIQGETWAHEAVEENRMDMLFHLIKKHKLDVNEKNNDEGYTIAHLLAYHGKIKELDFLVKKHDLNADVKAKDGSTLVHMAVLGNQQKMVDHLVDSDGEYKLNVKAKDNDDKTMLYLAAGKEHFEMFFHLIAKHGLQVQINDKRKNGHTIAHLLAHRGKIGMLDRLVDKNKLDVSVKTKNGSTLVHMAVIGNQQKMVDYLVDRDGKYKLDVKAKNNHEKTVLHFAADKGRFEMLSHLIEHHGLQDQINDKCKRGYTVAHILASKGKIGLLDRLVDKNKLDVSVKTKNGSTLVHMAVISKQQKMVDHLVDRDGKYKLDIKAKNNDENTVLHFAADKEHFEMLFHLIANHGLQVQINDKRKNSHTIAHLLAHRGKIELLDRMANENGLDVFVKTKMGLTLVHMAVIGNQQKMVDYLVDRDGEYKLNVKAKNNDKKTALHLAADKGRLNMLFYLIEKHGLKAQINDECKKGYTIAHLLAYNGKIKELELLVNKHGLNANVKAKDGSTLVHMAVSGNQQKMVDHLVDPNGKYKLNVKAKDNDDRTMLYLAVEKERRDINMLSHLIKNHGLKDQINDKCKNGYTIAHLLAYHGKIKELDFLVKKHDLNADVKAKDGSTLVHMAVLGNQQKMVDHLVDSKGKYKLDVKDKMNDGNTALHMAAHKGRFDMLFHLIENHGLQVQINDKCKNGYTIAHLLAHKGKRKMLDRLVKDHDLDVSVKTKKGSTLVHTAVIGNQKEMVKHLVDVHKLKIDAKNEHGNTVLHLAVDKGYVNMFSYLIKHYKNNNDETIAYILVNKGDKAENREMFDILKNSYELKIKDEISNGLNAAQLAAISGQKEMVKHLVKNHGLKLDSENSDGGGVLRALAATDEVDNLDSIIADYKLKPKEVKNENGGSLLHIAAAAKKKKMFDHLVKKHELDITAKNEKDEKPSDILSEILKKLENRNS